MKIQIDTINKTIKLEENVKLSNLVETLNKFFPNKEWEEFTLETNTVINNWHSPIVIERWEPRPYYQPWWGRTTYASNSNNVTADYNASMRSNGQYSLKAGVYDVEVSNNLLK